MLFRYQKTNIVSVGNELNAAEQPRYKNMSGQNRFKVVKTELRGVRGNPEGREVRV